MQHDDDNDDLRRANYERLFGTTVEREAEARELAERQARNKSEEVMAYARKLAAEREERLQREARGPTDELGRPLNDPRYKLDTVVTKSYGEPAAQPAVGADQRDGWRQFILQTVRKEFISKKRLENEFEALGKLIDQVDKGICSATREAREKALDPLRKRLDTVEAQVFELYQRAVQLDGKINEIRTRQQFDELNERIKQLEQSGRGLKVVGYG